MPRLSGRRGESIIPEAYLTANVAMLVLDWSPNQIVSLTLSSLCFAVFGIVKATRAVPLTNDPAWATVFPCTDGTQSILPPLGVVGGCRSE